MTPHAPGGDGSSGAGSGASRVPVVVVGDLVTDVGVHLREPRAVGSDAAARIIWGGGGAGANTAAWLATAGTAVTFVGRVGDDDAGRARVAELAATGVDARVARDPERPTGTIVVVVEPGAERTMFPDRGASLALAPDDLPPACFVAGHHLHLSGYTLLHPGPRPAGLAALERARSAGMTMSVDPASAHPLEAAGPDRFLEWTAGADLAFPNAAEAEVLSGCTDPEEAAQALVATWQEVVVTRGAQGAVWSDGTDVIHHRPDPGGSDDPAGAEDPTGAGDAFAAGFIAAWLGGADPQGCLRAGAQLAADAVRRVGPRP